MVDGFGIESVFHFDHPRFAYYDGRRCRCHKQVPRSAKPKSGDRSDSCRLCDGISGRGRGRRGASRAIGFPGGSGSGSGSAIFAFQRSSPSSSSSSPYPHFASANVAWVIGTYRYGRYAGIKSSRDNKLETNVGCHFSCQCGEHRRRETHNLACTGRSVSRAGSNRRDARLALPSSILSPDLMHHRISMFEISSSYFYKFLL